MSSGSPQEVWRLFQNCFPVCRTGFRCPSSLFSMCTQRQTDIIYTHFNNKCTLTIKEADDKEEIRPGFLYFAPPDYHLLIERDETFSLSIDARVNYSRPSIDVLFESAVYVWSSGLIGILLTGANNDGAHGMRLIKEHGGLTIAQDPATAEYPVMPKAAIDAAAVDKILSIEGIGEFLRAFSDTLDKGRQK